MPAYLTRTLEGFITGAAAKFPVLLLTGARQVGKTSLLRRLKEDGRAYVTLDDPLALRLAREDPPLFLQRFPAPVLIDEIQYAPDLLPYIKIAVDNDRRPGSYWLTGSQPLIQGDDAGPRLPRMEDDILQEMERRPPPASAPGRRSGAYP